MPDKDFAQRNQSARRHLATLPFEQKLGALIVLQQMARDMARAAGHPFRGVVWPMPSNRGR